MNGFFATIFSGPTQLLNQGIAYMSHLASVSAKGINISDYLGFLAVLDPAWQGVVTSLLSSFGFISILVIVRATYRAYLSIKAGVQWW